jgi:hypothetical protein
MYACGVSKSYTPREKNILHKARKSLKPFFVQRRIST